MMATVRPPARVRIKWRCSLPASFNFRDTSLTSIGTARFRIVTGTAFGNHDADTVPYLKAAAEDHGAVCLGWGGEITLAGRRLAVVHGHLTFDLRLIRGMSV